MTSEATDMETEGKSAVAKMGSLQLDTKHVSGAHLMFISHGMYEQGLQYRNQATFRKDGKRHERVVMVLTTNIWGKYRHGKLWKVWYHLEVIFPELIGQKGMAGVDTSPGAKHFVECNFAIQEDCKASDSELTVAKAVLAHGRFEGTYFDVAEGDDAPDFPTEYGGVPVSIPTEVESSSGEFSFKFSGSDGEKTVEIPRSLVLRVADVLDEDEDDEGFDE